jgi:hypothetical protein
MTLEINAQGDIQERTLIDVSEVRRRLLMLQEHVEQITSQIVELQARKQDILVKMDSIKAIIAEYKKG